MKREVLRLERVTCKKANSVILDNFSLSITEGEIMGLLPLDTYGLDELLELLVHNIPLYYGYVYYMEKCINSWKNYHHSENPISLIDSESTLVNGMSVATNVFVYCSEFHNQVIQNEQLNGKLQPYLKDLELKIDPDTPVERLSQLDKIIVEILRAVISGHRLIILREISTVLPEKELKVLFRIMQYYTNQGYSFLYISLHYEEILQICTRAAIMLNEGIETILEGNDLKSDVGKKFYMDYYDSVIQKLKNADIRTEKIPLLEIRHRTEKRDSNISFTVYTRECLVIQTLDTNLFHKMADILEGNIESPNTEFLLEGKKISIYSSRQIAVLKEEPVKSMLFPEMTVFDNLCISLDHRLPAVWRNQKIRNTIRQEFIRVIKKDIFNKKISELSQTEKIELVYMRILLQKPEIVFLEQPYKGADVEQRRIICELQETLVRRGISVVILAVNMADSLAVANRILRIDSTMQIREYKQREFSKLPKNLPWSGLFRDEFSKR